MLKYLQIGSKMCEGCPEAAGVGSEGVSMRRVDMGLVDLVHVGEAWPHAEPPCCKSMIQFLERNEGLVTWVQVRREWACGGGEGVFA